MNISFRHLTSFLEEEMEEFYDVTIEHPGDRIANADDENGIFTDWSKEYEAESIVSDEIMVFPYRRKSETVNRQKRVIFEEDQKLKECQGQGSKIKVDVELNPEAFFQDKKQKKLHNSVSSRHKEVVTCKKENVKRVDKKKISKVGKHREGERENNKKGERNNIKAFDNYWNKGFDASSNSSDNLDDSEEEDEEFTVDKLKDRWSQM